MGQKRDPDHSSIAYRRKEANGEGPRLEKFMEGGTL